MAGCFRKHAPALAQITAVTAGPLRDRVRPLWRDSYGDGSVETPRSERLSSHQAIALMVLCAGASGPILRRTMNLGGIDKSDPLALHEQVAAEVRRAIAEGEAGPGDRLPLARDLAAVLGVNRNTVLRALHVLRDEGLLEFRRGHGIRVTGTKEKSDLLVQVHDLVVTARRSGYRKSELIAMIEAVRG